jgi:hypothetical protein
MKYILTIFLAGFTFYSFSQSIPDKPKKQEKIKEVPSNQQGKMVSELAQENPGNREKGTLIQSAARQQGLQKNNGKGSGNQQQNDNRPEQTGKPEITGKPALNSGKANLPRSVPPSRPKPSAFNGRS